MLKVNSINVSYGDAQALWDVTFNVREMEICSLVGANGAGKTTVLSTSLGMIHPFSGQVEFLGYRIEEKRPNAIVDLGISLVPEGRRLFSKLTVLENLELGAFTKQARPLAKQTMTWVTEIFPILEERKRQLAGALSGGMQQMLAIGRGLMAKPKLLMLDEPSLGLAPLIVKMLFEVIQKLNDRHVTILLVEQNIHQALKISHSAFVMKIGKIVMKGKGGELMADPEIKKAYMGVLE
jgi:branched-chain amino acid transport system ATP-binding protein